MKSLNLGYLDVKSFNFFWDVLQTGKSDEWSSKEKGNSRTKSIYSTGCEIDLYRVIMAGWMTKNAQACGPIMVLLHKVIHSGELIDAAILPKRLPFNSH